MEAVRKPPQVCLSQPGETQMWEEGLGRPLPLPEGERRGLEQRIPSVGRDEEVVLIPASKDAAIQPLGAPKEDAIEVRGQEGYIAGGDEEPLSLCGLGAAIQPPQRTEPLVAHESGILHHAVEAGAMLPGAVGDQDLVGDRAKHFHGSDDERLTPEREERLERPDATPLPAREDETGYGGHVHRTKRRREP